MPPPLACPSAPEGDGLAGRGAGQAGGASRTGERGCSEMLAGARAHGEVVVEIHRVNDEGATGAEAATAGQLRELRAPFRDPAHLIEAGNRLRASPDREGNL